MDIDRTFEDEATEAFDMQANSQGDYIPFHTSSDPQEQGSPIQHSPNPTFEMNVGDHDTQYFTAHVGASEAPTKKMVSHESTTPAGSPLRSPQSSPDMSLAKPSAIENAHPSSEGHLSEPEGMETVPEEALGSGSEGSSPIRPVVRKSSLNFASLPAREPITHKSIGNRTSRTSHLEQNRTSYYNRHTGGKSLGNARHDLSDEGNDDDMDIDEDPFTGKPKQQAPEQAATHNKTYTQRLQDQISRLGQVQQHNSKPSKPILDPSAAQAAPVTAARSPFRSKLQSSPKKPTTPGAFPDDEDDWIQPLGSPEDASDRRSPRPGLSKSYTADVMEGVSGKETVGGGEFAGPKTRPRQSQSKSPLQQTVQERTPNALGHHKSASVPMLPLEEATGAEGAGLQKAISISNPSLAAVSETERPATPTKSPTRGFKDSPLKQVKNKLSSILKSSKGLLVSSAAISAEGKTSLLSPSTTRLGLHTIASSDSLASPQGKETQPLYPDLSRHAPDTRALTGPASPVRPEGRRTRASIEREKAEEKRKEKEAKEARRMAEQMEKLEKIREKEREKARVFSKEQEKIAAMEKQLAAQKELDKKALQTPANPSKSAQLSPRKLKTQPSVEERAPPALSSDDKQADDIDMIDAPNTMPPPSVPRYAAPPPSATKAREIKRPMRPGKEPVSKLKQAPTVIRVNMGSQHSQYHPSNSTLAANLQETLGQPQAKNKPNQSSLQNKQSLQSLKSSTSSTGRPKALEAAARRKEQEEREAQRRREAKAELERRRAAMQEEEKRQEQQRKAEAERQKEEERKQAEAKKNAQRQAMLEKAKQTRAPPPAARSQPNGPPDYSRAEGGGPRPLSRMTSTAQRSQEDLGRPINTTLSNASKAPTKRTLHQDHNDGTSRQPPARGGTSYQSKESKRLRMTDEFDDDVEMEKQPSLKGAPVRPSGGLKKVGF